VAVELNFVILNVRDVAGMRDFYRDALGLAVAAESPGFVQLRAAGGASFSLQAHDGPRPADTVELWWQAEDVDALHSSLVARDIAIVSPPTDQPFGRALTVRDPEGNAINFYAPRRG
jgi:catechol-2,3-dioxygenase